jgi:acetyl esterase/lipase
LLGLVNAFRIAALTAVLFAPLLDARPAAAAPSAHLTAQTRYFAYQDERYLFRDQRDSGAALLPDVGPAEPVPLVVLLHGVNPGGDTHLWLGGGARDLRPLAVALMQSGQVSPFVLAAPSQTKGANSTKRLWSDFDLSSFVDAVAEASAGSVEIDREHVVLMGHSGAGCNPDGGLASEFWTEGAPLPQALVSIDPCLDFEMGAAMSRRPVSVPLLLWWQSAIWRRDPLAFWAALTLDQPEQRLDRLQELRVAGANPHDAIVPLAFERTVRELFPVPRVASADPGA